MKFELIIDPESEEKVVVHAKKEGALTEEIKRLVQAASTELLGYRDNEIVRLNPNDIHCVCVMENKVYALCEGSRYSLRQRLYSLEETLPECFVKINQSCLANTKQMERFDTSISGTLKIRFKNGHIDYVSRRQLKAIKERLGI